VGAPRHRAIVDAALTPGALGAQKRNEPPRRVRRPTGCERVDYFDRCALARMGHHPASRPSAPGEVSGDERIGDRGPVQDGQEIGPLGVIGLEVEVEEAPHLALKARVGARFPPSRQ
jgi:hypothetical protein